MRAVYGWAILASMGWLIAVEISYAGISGLEQVATGLSSPAFATYAPGDANHLFVAELGGDIKIVDLNTNTVIGTFLDIADADAGGEGGLLGLAFHPDYAKPGTTGYQKFYVYVTVDNGELDNDPPFSSHIREYKVKGSNPNEADPASLNEVLSFVQPQDNHNAGWIGFSPTNKFLYIATGDGGNGWDSGTGHTASTGNAQDITDNFLGKMLRIDVNSDAFTSDDTRDYAIPSSNPFVDKNGDDEIWAYGLRNPFRDSFDRLTGDLWIGDVGQGQREEVDFELASSAGGKNFGWRKREGTVETDNGVGGPDLPEYTDPIYDYGRGDGDFLGETVIGGYRYRGPDPDLQGLYFFGDADPGNDNIWTLNPPNPVAPVTTVDNINTELGSLFNSFGRLGSFGEDLNGNLYIVDLFGKVFRIKTDNALAGDYNLDGEVNGLDYTVWRNHFGQNFPAADGDHSGTVNEPDFGIWKQNYGDSVHAPGGGGLAGVPEPATTALVAELLALGLLASRRRAKMATQR